MESLESFKGLSHQDGKRVRASFLVRACVSVHLVQCIALTLSVTAKKYPSPHELAHHGWYVVHKLWFKRISGCGR